MPRRIWVAVPSYPGPIEPQTVASLCGEMALLKERGDQVGFICEAQNCYIGDARGILVERFLNESDADVLAFVDSDVSWPAGKLAELIDAPGDVKVGIYPMRGEPLRWPLAWDETSPHLIAHPQDDRLIRIERGPTGFMVLERVALADMAARYRDLECYTATTARKRFVALFADYWRRGVELPDGGTGDLKFGDDYAFSARWRDMGRPIWAFPDITFGHTGPKTSTGNLGDWLLSRPQ
jgi:hypothetical protein